ncbi:VCBS domain-containing protein, partial [Pseudorhodobacter sp. E13]|uniref:VCBS domain-containing protein n=1 Tax=Pseudorhodobacter sp. E13 TaxID=2487931 RepID=UPI001315958B
VTVTIEGANDAAVIAGDLSGIGAEDSAAPITGTATAMDVDNDDNLFQPASGVGAMGYGTYSVDAGGAWSYLID